MKLYHFFILIFLALTIGAVELYFDYIDSQSSRPVKQVRVIYQDQQTEENYIEDDDHE